MKVWIFENNSSLPEYGGLNRQFYFGKYLKRAGQEPIVFVGSHPHSSELQFIEDHSPFRIYQEIPFPWVMVRTCTYKNSRLKRVWSMFQFYWNGKKAAKKFETPDIIIGSSPHPLAMLLAIRLGKKLGCKAIVEIRDLWPEAIVEFTSFTKRNPIIWLLYRLEKYIYAKADGIIFTMEGGKDYVIDCGWDQEHGGPVDLKKIYHINNGVDLEVFNHNKDLYQIQDADLNDPNLFKIVATGSVRDGVGYDALLDLAKAIHDPKIRFLIWGAGNKLSSLQQRTRDEGIDNVVFKGVVKKDYIPYILSQADLSLLFYEVRDIRKYGGSQNKFFDYLAGGVPVLTNLRMGYDLIDRYECGFHIDSSNIEASAADICKLANMPKETYTQYCNNARRAAKDYDFKVLTNKLIDVIKRTLEK